MASIINEAAERVINNLKSHFEARERERLAKNAYYKDRIKNYMKSIRDAVLFIQEHSAPITMPKEEEEQLRTDIELIAKHDTCETIDYEDDALYITTNTIYMQEPKTGRRYLLGNMEIKIPMDINDYISFKNISGNIKNSYHHPHVFFDGEACFGTALEGIAIYRAKNELYALYLTLINFLQTANIEDEIGVKICMWDEVDENNNVIKEGHSPEAYEYGNVGSYLDVGRGYYECERCGEVIDPDDARTCYDCCGVFCGNCMEYIEELDRYVCRNCFDENYSVCESCDAIVRVGNLYETYEGRDVCEDCLQDMAYCEGCGIRIANEDNEKELNGRIYCPDCYNEKKQEEDNEIAF